MITSFRKYGYLLIGLYALFIFGLTAHAFVRSSTNYRIQSDSMNSGGTDASFSNNYKAWDTVGDVGTGVSSSTNYALSAGYRQMEDSYIALSISTSSVTLSPNIGGLAGGVANGSGIWTVKTDNIAGYSLNIKATGSPALKSGTSNFADYAPSVAGVPDYTWSLGATNSEFGFSPYNVNAQPAKYKNNGGTCNIGSNITDGACWFGLSTTDEKAAYNMARTDINGEDTKINFKAAVKVSGGMQPSGSYSAGLIVTAVCN